MRHTKKIEQSYVTCDVCLKGEAEEQPGANIYNYEITPVSGIHRLDTVTVTLDLCESCHSIFTSLGWKKMFIEAIEMELY